jgi:hypothetical protein
MDLTVKHPGVLCGDQVVELLCADTSINASIRPYYYIVHDEVKAAHTSNSIYPLNAAATQQTPGSALDSDQSDATLYGAVHSGESENADARSF